MVSHFNLHVLGCFVSLSFLFLLTVFMLLLHVSSHVWERIVILISKHSLYIRNIIPDTYCSFPIFELWLLSLECFPIKKFKNFVSIFQFFLWWIVCSVHRKAFLLWEKATAMQWFWVQTLGWQSGFHHCQGCHWKVTWLLCASVSSTVKCRL